MSCQTTEGSFTCKQRTHERIPASAGRAFRRKGYAGSGVDELMREAGLTHGGFYARFRSKGRSSPRRWSSPSWTARPN